MKKEERKITTKLLEVEQMNTYKILAEFFARKFNQNGFDKEEEKWFNTFVTNQGTAVLYKSLQPSIVKKRASHYENAQRATVFGC